MRLSACGSNECLAPCDVRQRVRWLKASPPAYYGRYTRSIAPSSALTQGGNVTENRYLYQVWAYRACLKHCIHSQYTCGGGGHRKPHSKRRQTAITHFCDLFRILLESDAVDVQWPRIVAHSVGGHPAGDLAAPAADVANRIAGEPSGSRSAS
jgi:hypothetical protein